MQMQSDPDVSVTRAQAERDVTISEEERGGKKDKGGGKYKETEGGSKGGGEKK